MSVHQPQQAQERDEDNLAEERIAVDEEGNATAYHGRFDQIKNSHKTAFKFMCPGIRLPYARLADKAGV